MEKNDVCICLPKRYKQCETNMWREYSEMALKYNPLNLGQGAPNFGAPKILRDSLKTVAQNENAALHQYARCSGHLRLVNAIARLFSPLVRHEIDPLSEIIITNGASEALFCAISGIVEEGDEVIVFEPVFDLHVVIPKISDATLRFVSLMPDKITKKWIFDKDELEAAFNSKTKLIIVNTPHNPTGKVYTLDELEFIADLCKKWNVICIADEVYEWMIYEPNKHERIASLPDMWNRTLTIGSAGKTFCATGWKTGWAYGPSHLIHNMMVVFQNTVYTCQTPLQEALALAIEHVTEDDSYFVELVNSLRSKRDFTVKFLNEAGFLPMTPEGGYFVVANWSSLAPKVDLDSEVDEYRDFRFTKWATKNIGVQMIPVSAFYENIQNKLIAQDFIRICFIKDDESLHKAETIFQNWLKN